MRIFSYKEEWQELLHTLAANKLRTALTGFAVGWGILLLVVLLSSGKGLEHGMAKNIESNGFNQATVELWLGSTTIAYKTFPRHTRPNFSIQDLEAMERELGDWVLRAVGRRYLSRYSLAYEGRSTSAQIVATMEGYTGVRQLTLKGANSRFINDTDQREVRKVVVIGNRTCQELFSSADEAIGKTIMVNDIPMQVIGVHASETDQETAYMPLATQALLGLEGDRSRNISGATLLVPRLKTEEDERVFRTLLTRWLAKRKGFSPEDKGVVSLYSRVQNLQMMGKIFSGINLFLWILGLSTLAIGVIGVVNIMQIVVSERRKEIGIRKALGARPMDIIRMILLESVFVTTVSGLAGLVVGVGLMRMVGYVMDQMQMGQFSQAEGMDASVSIFLNPMIDLPNAVGAIVVMILGGLLAGYIPARKAVSISAVDAMRH